MTHITMVIKELAEGVLCRKCREVMERMEQEGLMDRVDRLVSAAANDPDSEGMRLALHHGMARAPFFIVRHGDGSEHVYDSYLRFRRELVDASRDPLLASAKRYAALHNL